ncbi:MAG: hypothetical protein KZQ82_17125 [Candidatus Thiodiazotropha sp. (ex Lucinoma annulata)]|nr:hypothetical protein [Candidatus Thiodiazotropha sp. (ex Lucinoma annulata)]
MTSATIIFNMILRPVLRAVPRFSFMQVDELSGETPGMSLRLTIPLPVRRCAVRSYVPAIRDRSEAGRTLSSTL